MGFDHTLTNYNFRITLDLCVMCVYIYIYICIARGVKFDASLETQGF